MENADILNFFFELGQLRRIKRDGWRLIGIDAKESVAEHSLRAAQIGYVLAKMESYERPEEVCSMVVFHELDECRIGDINKVANGYISTENEAAVKDQTEGLGDIGEEIRLMWKSLEEKSTKAGIIAKDAEILELALTAKEYIENGHVQAQNWIDNSKKRLKTDSAKKLAEDIELVSSNDWWKGLKRF